MFKSFRFHLALEDTQDQHVVFVREGEEPIKIPVTGRLFSQDPETRFREMYQVLIDGRHVPDKAPVLNL